MSENFIMVNVEENNFVVEECPDCKNYCRPNFFSHIQSMFNSGKRIDEQFGFLKSFEAIVKFWNVWAYSGIKSAKKNLNRSVSGEYHLIIILKLNPVKDLITFSSGNDLLIDYFQKKKVPYKVIFCDNEESFKNEIIEENAQYLWIFGHGDRHGVFFRKQKYFPYCRLKNAPKKRFIAQLHCCNGSGNTLGEYLSTNSGIFSSDFRNSLRNREDIKKWMEDEGTIG